MYKAGYFMKFKNNKINTGYKDVFKQA